MSKITTSTATFCLFDFIRDVPNCDVAAQIAQSTAWRIDTLIQGAARQLFKTVREDQYKTLYQRKQIEGYVPALGKTFVFNIKNIDAEGEFATLKNTRQSGGYDIRSFKFELQPQAPIAELKVGMSVVFKVQQAR